MDDTSTFLAIPDVTMTVVFFQLIEVWLIMPIADSSKVVKMRLVGFIFLHKGVFADKNCNGGKIVLVGHKNDFLKTFNPNQTDFLPFAP